MLLNFEVQVVGGQMKKKNREQIIELLKRVDRSLDHCGSIGEACESVGISRSSFYRWQRKILAEANQYGHHPKSQRKHIQQLEDQVTALSFAARGN